MNVIQSVGTSLMVWGCAQPVCFFQYLDQHLEYVEIIGMFTFWIGAVIFIGGSETSYTIKTVVE
jgi:hypothetical protein